MSTTAEQPTVVEDPEPPAPDAVFRVVNPLMSLLLRSPLHGLVSDSLCLLRFTGRRSGDTYTTPVGYTQFEDRLVVFTHSPWWRNLVDGVPVSVHLRGAWREGTATAHPDAERTAELVAEVLDAEGLAVARRVGLDIDGGVPSTATLADAIEETVAIEIRLS